jgi:type II secretory ATPase GspE/PulE/Tfp pilus assembly ATPase PilB-like protein
LSDRVLVRFRIDGLLKDIIDLPSRIHPALVARAKILSNLKIDEHRIPQDGRFKFKFENQEIPVRLSIMPTFYGEKIEMRLLAETLKPLNLAELGFSARNLKIVTEAMAKHDGLILATGPTGSGKTTTLYTILHILNKPQLNISTVEDPIEYDIRRVNQIQVNPSVGLTFAKGLRSLLRQDPDIIMVGEVRDKETAEMVVHSALTGHLVLSTLHTKDAASALPRILDIGVEPYLASSTLNVIIAQRLVRRICLKCIKSYRLSKIDEEKVAEELKIKKQIGRAEIKVPGRLYKATGCRNCGNTGYKGQIGIFEVLEITPKISKLISSRSDTIAIKKKATKEGMITLLEDGLNKAASGITTLDEVIRVLKE